MTPTANKVHKLDAAIANQIAAGEVIERPANACKELVENALDAGARRITIDIEDGGKKLIRVRDDGCGMNAGDAVLSLQRHATSKLREAADLFAIRTLGFRGEALPSIAAVSNVELTTREAASDLGTRLVIEAGTVNSAEEVGCAQGTEFAVRNLFYNTPARFKFLKSDSAEAARIAEMVGHMALAYPSVTFQLRHNGNDVLRVEAGGNAFNAVICVLGRDAARQMLPLAGATADDSGITVTGFAGRPQLTRANRNGQIFFVNGRVVRNRVMQHAVAQAYEGLVHGHGRFPLAIVFIQMPPGAVDVNVHPTKSEVRFAREWEVHHAVRVALRDTLLGAQLAPEWGLGGHAAPTMGTDAAPAPQAEHASNGATVANGDATYPPAANGLGFSVPPAARPGVPVVPPTDYRGLYRPMTQGPGDLAAFRQAYQQTQVSNQIHLPDLEPPPPTRLQLRPLAQISRNAYILCEGEDGLYIVCQHRAHERILADRTIAAAEGQPVESQHLVIPFTAEVGPRAAAALEENATLLQGLGFTVEGFGGSSVLVRAVPALVASRDYQRVFSDVVDELIGGSSGRTIAERRRQLLTMMACKNAIKAGDPLSAEQMAGLITDLVEVDNPSICPHGQPILIKISTLELDKKFEREYASRG